MNLQVAVFDQVREERAAGGVRIEERRPEFVKRFCVNRHRLGCEVVGRQVQTVLALVDHRVLARLERQPQTTQIGGRLTVFVATSMPVTPYTCFLESDSLSIEQKLHGLSDCAAARTLLRLKLRGVDGAKVLKVILQVRAREQRYFCEIGEALQVTRLEPGASK